MVERNRFSLTTYMQYLNHWIVTFHDNPVIEIFVSFL